MPFSKLTHKRTFEVYKDMLAETILKVNGNIDIKIHEYLIKAEIQKRDFTKRQLNILSLIITFSYNYGKETALLKINDFALCGVPAKKVNSEISKLIDSNIITWNKDFNEFSIIEPRYWKDVPYHSYYDDKRSMELFFLNLKHAGYDPNPILEKLNELKDD
jgi:hypothetical protein